MSCGWLRCNPPPPPYPARDSEVTCPDFSTCSFKQNQMDRHHFLYSPGCVCVCVQSPGFCRKNFLSPYVSEKQTESQRETVFPAGSETKLKEENSGYPSSDGEVWKGGGDNPSQQNNATGWGLHDFSTNEFLWPHEHAGSGSIYNTGDRQCG